MLRLRACLLGVGVAGAGGVCEGGGRSLSHCHPPCTPAGAQASGCPFGRASGIPAWSAGIASAPQGHPSQDFLGPSITNLLL